MYFIGDKRVASKIGTGQFNNIYGINGNIVTAGQHDYATLILNIEAQREECTLSNKSAQLDLQLSLGF